MPQQRDAQGHFTSSIVGVAYQTVSYPLLGGMDTKVASPHLQRPQLQLAQNCWADQTGELRKRYGYTQFSTLTDILGATITDDIISLVKHEDTFLAFTDRYAYGYIPGLQRFSLLGGVMSARVSVEGFAGNANASATMVDHATANGYTVYAQYEITSSGTGQVRWVLVDSTGAVVRSRLLSSSLYCRCVARGNFIYIFMAQSATNNIRVQIIDTTSAATLAASVVASVVTVATDYDNGAGLAFDAVSNTTYGVFLAYRSTTANTIAFGFVNSAGALGSTSTLGTTSDSFAISCAVASNDSMHGIVYVRRTTPDDVYAALRSWNGAAWTSTATSGAITTGAGSIALNNEIASTACAFETNNTTLTIWYGGDAPTTTSTDFNDRLYQGSYTTAGVATAVARTIHKCALASKPFKYQGGWYAALLVGDANGRQPNIFIVSLDGDEGVAEPAQGTPVARITSLGFVNVSSTNYFGQVTQPSAGVFRYAFIQRRATNWTGADVPPVYPSGAVATLEIAPYDRHASVQVGRSTYIAGGILLHYDGVNLVEAGFLRYVDPDTVVAQPSNGAGALSPSGDYSYHIVPQWTSAEGIREQGTNAGSVTVTMSGTDDTVTLSIPTITLTMKSNIVFAIYRTTLNGDSFYLIGTVANSTTTEEVTFVDTAADNSITTHELFPYADGALLDNAPPPSGSVMTEANGRVYIAAHDTLGKIYASKTREADEPLTFNEALTIVLPDDGAEITGLAPLGGTLVAFTERGIYRIAGEGIANATANGAPVGQWLAPESLTVDTGASCQRSVVVTPPGLMFRGTKGLHLLDQGFQLQYIGAALENLSMGAPGLETSGLLVPERQQVRFASGDYAYVYDYYHRQWYVWSFATDGPDAIIGGVHHALQDGEVFSEAEQYDDDGASYTMSARLAWMRDPSTLLGEVRVRRVGVTGFAAANATISVAVANNFDAATTETKTKAITSGNQFFAKWRLRTKVTPGTQLTISETSTDAGLRLHEIAFEVGPRSTGLGRKG